MARIRSIHPDQWSDEDFAELSMAARLLTIAVRNFADDKGVFEWKPIGLKIKVFPVDVVDVAALLAELERGNHVRRFEVDGRSYGAIRNFGLFQRPQKPNSLYPLPDSLRGYVALDEERSTLGGDEWPQGNWAAIRTSILLRDGRICAYCGSIVGPFDIDHVFPRSRGGTNAAGNLVVACASCNRSKGARTPEEWRPLQ